MASYVEDNTSQGKGWIFDSSSTVYGCSQKKLFNNFLVAKEERIIKMVDGSLAMSLALGEPRLQKEMRWYMLQRQSGMSRKHDTI